MQYADVHRGTSSEDIAFTYLLCGACAFWVPLRPLSRVEQASDGVCSRRQWPRNRTKAEDGCMEGKRPMEAT